jgi:hypothetical protein
VLAALALLGGAAKASAVDASYRGVDFITASSGWVVGRDATIVHTGNGGRTWTQQHHESGGPVLLDVCVLADGRNGWAVGEAGAVYRTANGRTWTRVVSGNLDASLSYTSVKAARSPSGIVVWVCGGFATAPTDPQMPYGDIVRSLDGGVSWEAPSIFLGWAPKALDSVNYFSATCFGVQRVSIGTAYNVVAVSQTSDGSSWGPTQLVSSPDGNATVNDMDIAVGGARIVAVGRWTDLLATLALYSSNYGGSFSQVLPPPFAAGGPAELTGVKMATSTVGYAVGTGSASILKTTNGGATWRVKRTAFGRELWAVDFTSASTGYAVGLSSTWRPLVIKTTNGGSRWTRVR